MEQHSNIIDQVFQPVYEQPCWNVQPGIGSFLTLEFGQPHLIIHEPREPQSSQARETTARRLVYPRGD